MCCYRSVQPGASQLRSRLRGHGKSGVTISDQPVIAHSAVGNAQRRPKPKLGVTNGVAMSDFGTFRASALPPEELLKSLLASAAVAVSIEQAKTICVEAGLLNGGKTRTLARRLEREVAKLGFQLRHNYAMDVVSQITGKPVRRSPQSEKVNARPMFQFFVSVEGLEVASFSFDNLGDALDALLETVVVRMPDPQEPGIARLMKLPSALSIDIRLAESSWFEVSIFCFREDSCVSGDLTPIFLDDDELRAAFRRTVAFLGEVRPALLIRAGAVPQTVPPWAIAWFQLISVEDERRYPWSGEEGLFVFFDSHECDRVEIKNGIAYVHGRDGTYRIECKWRDVAFARRDKTYCVEVTEGVQDVWSRYLKYREAIGQSVQSALASIAGHHGSFWSLVIDHDAMYMLMQQHKLDARQLAQKAGVAYREVKALDEKKHADPHLIAKLATALNVEPDRFLELDQRAAGFVAIDLEVFIELVKGTSEVLAVKGDSLGEVEEGKVSILLERMSLLAEHVALALREASTISPDSETLKRVDGELASLIGESERHGIQFVFFHVPRFVKRDVPTIDTLAFRAINVLVIRAERGNSLRDRYLVR
jgi:transcriptional regulator with XRE-family HTH domain